MPMRDVFRSFLHQSLKAFETLNGESHSTSTVTRTQSLPDLSTIILPNDIQDPNSKLINVCAGNVCVDIDVGVGVGVVDVGDD